MINMKTIRCGWTFIHVMCIFNLILQTAIAGSAPASMNAIPNIASRDNEQDVLSFLSYRNVESSTILQRAAVIFQAKLSDSSPLQDAALELLKTCKSAEDLSTPSKSADSIKDAAKSTYAIKAALISLSTASVKGPSACNSFGVHSGHFAFLSAVNGIRGRPSTPSTNDRARCVGELWKTDNSWTSYSNGLQDANTLCQVPSLENGQRAIMNLLSDMNNIIPAWLETFDQSQKSQLEFMRQQKAYAEDLNKLQRRQREDMDDNHEAAKGVMNDVVETTKTHVNAMTSDLRRELLSAGSNLVQMHEAVTKYILDFLMLRDEQARMAHAYQKTFADAVAVQSHGLTEVKDTVQSVVQSLGHIYGGLEEQVHAISSRLGSEMREISRLHGRMLGNQHQLMEYQDESIQHQKEISAFALQLKGEIADITTAISSVGSIFSALSSFCRADMSSTALFIALLSVTSILLLTIGFRQKAILTASLAVLSYLSSLAWTRTSPWLARLITVTCDWLCGLGRILFVLGIKAFDYLGAFAPGPAKGFRHAHSLLHLTLLSALLITIFITVLHIMRRCSTKNPRMEPEKRPKGIANSSSIMESKFPSQLQSHDRLYRAATLPPTRKPQWEG